MKNILILNMFLFIAFFFISCDGSDGETGASGLTGPTGLIGETGSAGLDGTDGATGADGADGADGAEGATGVSGLGIPDGHHIDIGGDGVFRVCLDDYHLHEDGDVCRTDIGGYDIEGYNIDGWDFEGYNIAGLDSDGCTRTQTWTKLPVGDPFCWDH